MSGFKDSFYNSVRLWLVDRGVDAVEVVDVEQNSYQEGYCETCEYKVVEIDILYKDSKGRLRYRTFDGSMTEFLSALP